MELYYRNFGDGPPLIIVHGLYGASDNWLSARHWPEISMCTWWTREITGSPLTQTRMITLP